MFQHLADTGNERSQGVLIHAATNGKTSFL